MGNPLTDDIYTMKSDKTVSLEDGISWERTRCPHCGSAPMFVVATALDGNLKLDPVQRTRWLRCPSCLRGSVSDRGTLHPAPMPLRDPHDLPVREAEFWDEVRRCLGAGANAATVLLCRSMVRRMAVDHELSSEDPQLREIPFSRSLDHLAGLGLISARVRDAAAPFAALVDRADRIDSAPVGSATAEEVAAYTLRLLEALYVLAGPDGARG